MYSYVLGKDITIGEKIMRKGLLYIAVLGMTVALVACGKKEESPSKIQQSDSTTIDEEEITGEVVSYLTGLPISEEVKNSRPLAVMLNNKKEGCPQSGIADAAIVYEAPVEGRITRLMALYDDYRNLEKVGSIRSRCSSYYGRYACFPETDGRNCKSSFLQF